MQLIIFKDIRTVSKRGGGDTKEGAVTQNNHSCTKQVVSKKEQKLSVISLSSLSLPSWYKILSISLSPPGTKFFLSLSPLLVQNSFYLSLPSWYKILSISLSPPGTKFSLSLSPLLVQNSFYLYFGLIARNGDSNNK